MKAQIWEFLAGVAPEIAVGILPEYGMEEDTPPVTKYRPQSGLGEQYLEFLVSRRGGALDRQGRARTTLEIGGVSAQQLAHLQLLLESPWEVELAYGNDAPQIILRVSDPAAYIAQKLVIFERRGTDQSRDLLYIHDTVQLFSDTLELLGSDWCAGMAATLSRKERAALRSALEELVTNPGIRSRDSEDILRALGRDELARAFRSVLQVGLAAIFG